MLLMGDEARHSQGGNNNAYCQDNEVSWFDWELAGRNTGLRRFVRELIARRLHRDVVTAGVRLSLNELLRLAPVQWHGVRLNQPDWGDDSHALALTARSLERRFCVHLMINAWWEDLTFEIPYSVAGGAAWRLWIDTARPSPEDIRTWNEAPLFNEPVCPVRSRSIVALVSSSP